MGYIGCRRCGCGLIRNNVDSFVFDTGVTLVVLRDSGIVRSLARVGGPDVSESEDAVEATILRFRWQVRWWTP